MPRLSAVRFECWVATMAALALQPVPGSGAVPAQSRASLAEVSGIVRGLDVETVVDRAVTGLGNVKVSLRTLPGVVVQATQTNAQGEYRLHNVPLGKYKLTAERQGFRTDGPLDLVVTGSAPIRKVVDMYVVSREDPGLPRVLLIGDSISIGYTAPLRELLRGKANVYRIPDAVGTVKLRRNLKRWLAEGDWDLVHFNCGLHDILFTNRAVYVSPEEYEKNLRDVVCELKATRARLLWATTTPVPVGGATGRNSEDVVTYNAIARKVMD